jgi:hypothetical protein
MLCGDLLGRARETAELGARVRDATARLTTLVGPGGVGKTTLGMHVTEAARMAFANGTAVVELASVNAPELVLPAVCQSLGVQDAGDRPLVDSLLAHLSDKHVLVLLDNCEHLLAASVAVAQLLLRCPRVHILATSREALRLRSECVYALGPLALPSPTDDALITAPASSPAVALFVARARQALATFSLDAAEEARAVADICITLDGLPLPSSWRPPGCACCHRGRFEHAWRTASTYCAVPTMTSPIGRRRCERHLIGATTCSIPHSRRCCGASRSSRAASASNRPDQWAMPATLCSTTSPRWSTRA